MSVASRTRALLPLRLQPFARYHYERWRGLLERELPLFCDRVSPNDLVVDVGANVGIYVHALTKRGAIVEAFEPQPACAEVLRAYATVNPTVHVHTNALGAVPSTVSLSVPMVDGTLARGSATTLPLNGDVAGETIDVQVRTLDSYGFDRVAAMKIDVEGAELDVIRGAAETLARWRPLLLVEIEQRHHAGPISEVFSLLETMGYSGEFLLPGRGLRPVAEFRPGEHQRYDPQSGPHGTYVNNFLFTAG